MVYVLRMHVVSICVCLLCAYVGKRECCMCIFEERGCCMRMLGTALYVYVGKRERSCMYVLGKGKGVVCVC